MLSSSSDCADLSGESEDEEGFGSTLGRFENENGRLEDEVVEDGSEPLLRFMRSFSELHWRQGLPSGP